jgi:hypothetical protein
MVGTSVWVPGEVATHCEPAGTAWGPVEWGRRRVQAPKYGLREFFVVHSGRQSRGKGKASCFSGTPSPRLSTNTFIDVGSALFGTLRPFLAKTGVWPGSEWENQLGIGVESIRLFVRDDDVAGRRRKCRSEARPRAQSPQDDIVSSDAEMTSEDADKAGSGESGVRIDVRQSRSRDIARKRKHFDNKSLAVVCSLTE